MRGIYNSGSDETELDRSTYTSSRYVSEKEEEYDDEEVASISVQAPTRLDKGIDESVASSIVRQMADLGGHSGSASFMPSGIEIELDSNTHKTTFNTGLDSILYKEEENYEDDEVSSVFVQTPDRLDRSVKESLDGSVVRQLAYLEKRKHKSRSTKYLRKFPFFPHSSSSRKSQQYQDQPTSTDKQKIPTSPHPNPSQSNPTKASKNIERNRVYDLEAQMRRVHKELQRKNQKRIKIISSKEDDKGQSSCFGSICSNHVMKITILVAYCLVVTALGGWLLQQFFRIPGLNQEINDLSEQVQLLQIEVDELNGVLDRLDVQIDELKKTNSELEKTAENLENENQQAKDLVEEFNDANQELKILNSELRTENTRFINYTASLNQTVEELVTDLAASTESRQALTESLNEYIAIKETLEDELSILLNATGDLNSTIQELNEAIEVFQDENDRFRTIVSFLEDEANGVQHSYDELAEALADTIIRKSTLAEIGVKERMKAELAGWECGLQTAFGTQPFIENLNLPIGFISYDNVINYVDDRLFDDFCIDSTEFEVFLREQIVEEGNSVWTINLSDFTRGVNIYTSEVLNYYFPDEDDVDGLDSLIWDAANYECSNLLQEQKYSYSST